jgi:glyoxylase-like metal-dependent hydrolase (beta-lactamase superfamily II)
MKRRIILGSLLVLGAISIAVAQQAPQPSANALMVTKLKDNLYVLKGGGGNTSVFITANGVTVVDTKNPGWGSPVLEKIKGLTDKPVTTIINSHTHGDHVSGNVEFPATVDIIVQANTAENMKKMIPNSTAADQKVPAQTIFQQNGNKGLAKHTFKDKMTIGKGADEIDLFYFGRGHTNGDAWVLFPAIRVLHAADIFSGKNIPLLDANNGGSATEIGNSLDKAYNTLNGKYDTVITGHANEMTPADLKEYAQFNRDFVADVKTAMGAGKNPDEVASSWKIPAKYQGYTQITNSPGDQTRIKNNVNLAWKEVGGKTTKATK